MNSGMSEGMGLLVVVTGSAVAVPPPASYAPRPARTRPSSSCAPAEYAPSSRFIVDATSTETMIASWTALIVGSSQAVLS